MRSLIILFLVWLGLFSCRNDSSGLGHVMAENLEATWVVMEASRNNRPALSLEKSEFYIRDSLFSTNFLPDTSSYPYSYDGEKIVLLDKAKSVFHVSRKAPDTLIFKTEIKNFDFKFIAVKKMEEND
jgi:hypothetical protein